MKTNRTSRRRQFDRLAGACFQNALRLHLDAIRLYKARSYPSALALSILAMEELAKTFLVEDSLWHDRVDDVPVEEAWQFMRIDLRNHVIKQSVFANRARPPRYDFKTRTSIGDWFWKLVLSGDLERLKQSATYVGLSTGKSAKARTRIASPSRISARRARAFITVVSDYLIDLVVGHLRDYYDADSDAVRAATNSALLRRLLAAWRPRGRIGVRAMKWHRMPRDE